MIVGKTEKVVKGDRASRPKIPVILVSWIYGFESVGNATTRNCIYLLDTTRDSPQNHRNFSNSFRLQGAGMEKVARRYTGCGLHFYAECPDLIGTWCPLE